MRGFFMPKMWLFNNDAAGAYRSFGGLPKKTLTPSFCGFPRILRQERICPTCVKASAKGPLSVYEKEYFELSSVIILMKAASFMSSSRALKLAKIAKLYARIDSSDCRLLSCSIVAPNLASARKHKSYT